MNPRKKTKFIRQSGRQLRRLKEKWRRPKGIQNKLRQHKRSRGHIPNVGYGSPLSLRGLHPSGFEEFLVYNTRDLENLDSNRYAARIASGVGKRKRIEIMKVANERKIKVLNPFKIEEKKKDVHADKRE